MTADTIDLPDLIEGDYLLRARSDFPAFAFQAGDWLTGRQQDTAEPDQIVVAVVDGGATLRLFRDLAGARMLGLVTGMFRRLG